MTKRLSAKTRARRAEIRKRWAEIHRAERALRSMYFLLGLLRQEEDGVGCIVHAMKLHGQDIPCRFFQADATRGSGCAHQPIFDRVVDGVCLCDPMRQAAIEAGVME